MLGLVIKNYIGKIFFPRKGIYNIIIVKKSRTQPNVFKKNLRGKIIKSRKTTSRALKEISFEIRPIEHFILLLYCTRHIDCFPYDFQVVKNLKWSETLSGQTCADQRSKA